MYHAIATHRSADYHRKAEAIQMTDDRALDENGRCRVRQHNRM